MQEGISEHNLKRRSPLREGLGKELLRQVQRHQEKCLVVFEGHTVGAEGRVLESPGMGVSYVLPSVSIPEEEGQSLPLGAAVFPSPAPCPPYFHESLLIALSVERRPESMRAASVLVLNITAVATVNNAHVDRLTPAPEIGTQDTG